MGEKLRTKVTWINDKYHVRLLEDDYVINEIACKKKIDIGYCISYLLRWYDKLGGESQMAFASRNRTWNQRFGKGPEGKIWYEKELRPKYLGAMITT